MAMTIIILAPQPLIHYRYFRSPDPTIKPHQDLGTTKKDQGIRCNSGLRFCAFIKIVLFSLKNRYHHVRLMMNDFLGIRGKRTPAKLMITDVL